METLVIDIETDKLQQLKDFLVSLNVQFRKPIVLSKGNPYDPEYVTSILKGKEDYKNGKCKTIALDDLWK